MILRKEPSPDRRFLGGQLAAEPLIRDVRRPGVDQQQIEKLKREMGDKRYYLDEELSLRQLAEYLELKPVELTELIKASEYENFYDLVNTYRIDQVKEQLKQSDEQIIQLAYQNGFKSKSTFNKIFKEKTGFTPKAYRLSIK